MRTNLYHTVLLYPHHASTNALPRGWGGREGKKGEGKSHLSLTSLSQKLNLFNKRNETHIKENGNNL